MLRLSKLTDYGIVLMGYMARDAEISHAARELSTMSGLPLPTVSKVLKSLSRGGLLVSHRGKNGGYTLAHAARDISVAQMIRVLEGPVRLTECSHAPVLCELESRCPVRGNWESINQVVYEALDKVSLADLTPAGGCGETTETHASPTSNVLLELVKR